MSSPLPPQSVSRARVTLVLRLVVLVACVGAGVALAVRGTVPAGVAAAILAVLALWTGTRVVRAAERPGREMRRFLEGLRYDDASHRVARTPDMPPGLADAFDRVEEAFRRVRAEREEQANYLQAVVRHVGVALVGFRSDGTITLFNPAARRLLAVPAPRALATLADRAPEAARTLAAIRTGERALVRLDRGERTLELVAYGTRFSLEGETHTLVSLQDIREELEARELEAWQQLTRVLTHEITNSVAPIASLAGTATGLLATGAPERLDDVREALATIERRSRGLVSFVEAYRTLAQLPAPTATVTPAAELLRGLATLMGTSARDRGVALDVTVDPERLELVADVEMIEQALVNLVLNAIEAAAGTPGARVELRAWAGPGGRAVIAVADNGPGIEPDVLERVFVPFFSTKAGGSGIGLSLAHRIARLHGGTLTVESEPDVRTAFTLRL